MLSVWEPEHVDLADDLTPFAAVDALGGTADGAKVTRFRTFLGRTVTVAQGEMITFEPEQAHAPLIGEGTIHKAIFKVKVA